MFLAALRDLQWRRRRFTIAVLATALVFALTLVLTGLERGFGAEAGKTVNNLGADGWVISKGSAGPLLGARPFAADVTASVEKVPGVKSAAPLLYSRKTINEDDPTDVNVLGSRGDGPAAPKVSEGRTARRRGEIAVSSKLGLGVGEGLTLGGRRFRVVGIVGGSTAVGGTANVFPTLRDAQAVSAGDLSIASTVAITGHPSGLGAGTLADFRLMDNAGARADLLRPLKEPRAAIRVVAILLWIIAAAIVGSVVYLSALERIRDFAVFKATGSSTSAIVGDLALQAVVLSLASAVVGAAMAVVLSPRFPLPVEIPAGAFLALPVIAMVIGLVASLAGLRRAVSVDPALAFGGP